VRRTIIPVLAALAALTPAVALANAGTASADSGTLFIRSAVEHPDGTATFPLLRGTSQGRTVYYVQLDSSDGNRAQTIGVNKSQKLANAANTDAVQHVTVTGGVVDFPASVDFSRPFMLQAPNGFPPTVFQSGAVGETGYSPLIQRPDGTVDNAPQIARDQNGDGRIDLLSEAADKVVSIDTTRLTVTYKETNGFQGGKAVRYVLHRCHRPAGRDAGGRHPRAETERCAQRGRRQHPLGAGRARRVRQRPDRRGQPPAPGPELGRRRGRRPAQCAGLEPFAGPVQPAVGCAPGPVVGPPTWPPGPTSDRPTPAPSPAWPSMAGSPPPAAAPSAPPGSSSTARSSPPPDRIWRPGP